MRAAYLALLLIACGSPSPASEATRAETVDLPEHVADPEPESEPNTEREAEPARALEPSAAERTPSAEADAVIPDPVATLLNLTGDVSTSIGGPRDGRIEGAVELPAVGPGFRSNMARPNTEARYGSVEMVQALVHAAGVVADEMPGSTVTMNDLGFEDGGAIPHHGSHRAGRDVDVLFYLMDREGEPMDGVGAFLDARGRGFDFRDLADPRDDVLVRLDRGRTWRFVQALLEGPHGDLVQRIFVAEHLRTLLVNYAERARAPRAIRDRFAEITCQPGYPHDDHLHVRFFCTPEDMAGGCEDAGPTYRWRRVQLRAMELRPVINRPRPDRPMAPTVTHDEARANAGRMHSRVEEWLARREAWLEPPHPGRPFCQ